MLLALQSFQDVQDGKLPDFPAIEWYFHTTVDKSMQDKEGHHNSALFVQWVPYSIKGSSWEKEEDRYVKHLLSICDRFAPGTASSDHALTFCGNSYCIIVTTCCCSAEVRATKLARF